MRIEPQRDVCSTDPARAVVRFGGGIVLTLQVKPVHRRGWLIAMAMVSGWRSRLRPGPLGSGCMSSYGGGDRLCALFAAGTAATPPAYRRTRYRGAGVVDWCLAGDVLLWRICSWPGLRLPAGVFRPTSPRLIADTPRLRARALSRLALRWRHALSSLLRLDPRRRCTCPCCLRRRVVGHGGAGGAWPCLASCVTLATALQAVLARRCSGFRRQLWLSTASCWLVRRCAVQAHLAGVGLDRFRRRRPALDACVRASGTFS